VSPVTAPGQVMLIAGGMCIMCLLVVPVFGGTCPDETALDFFKHQIAYERTGRGLYPLKGLPLIHTNVWVRGPITGFYIREELPKPYIAGSHMTYVVGEYGSDSGNGCPVEKDWRKCIAELAGDEHSTDPIRTCTKIINLRAIPAWRPSPNGQKKKLIADALRREIEANWQGASEIVIRDFNLKDNQITIYLKMPDGVYYQGCGFYATREPHCQWRLFGQTPLSSIRKWIFERPYKLR
jgi:hypothetical protein